MPVQCRTAAVQVLDIDMFSILTENRNIVRNDKVPEAK